MDQHLGQSSETNFFFFFFFFFFLMEILNIKFKKPHTNLHNSKKFILKEFQIDTMDIEKCFFFFFFFFFKKKEKVFDF